MGRPRKQPQLSTSSKRTLIQLFERRRRKEAAYNKIVDKLALAAMRASDEEGASRSEVARALGVGTSTVQGWVKRGRLVASRRGI